MRIRRGWPQVYNQSDYIGSAAANDSVSVGTRSRIVRWPARAVRRQCGERAAAVARLRESFVGCCLHIEEGCSASITTPVRAPNSG